VQALDPSTVDVFIYGLSERGIDEIRYIGQARNPAKRLKAHGREALSAPEGGPPRCAWIRDIAQRHCQLRSQNLYKTTVEHADMWEEFFISAYSAKGHKLLNVANNGKAASNAYKERLAALPSEPRASTPSPDASVYSERDMSKALQEQSERLTADFHSACETVGKELVAMDHGQWESISTPEVRDMAVHVALVNARLDLDGEADGGARIQAIVSAHDRIIAAQERTIKALEVTVDAYQQIIDASRQYDAIATTIAIADAREDALVKVMQMFRGDRDYLLAVLGDDDLYAEALTDRELCNANA